MKKQFSAFAVLWFDKINGNTYHSVRVTNMETGETIACPFQYGYGDQYRQTALNAMLEKGWIPKRYGKRLESGISNLYAFESENDYPILWNCTNGKKREAIDNGTL